MFIHFQDTDNKNERWHVTRATVKEEVAQSAKHLSVFAVSAVPMNGDEATFVWEDQTHQPVFGFPFDIDRPSIREAAQDLQKLLDALVGMGVDLTYVELFASGSKGFHVLIPTLYYSSGRAGKFLPQIYKYMAARIKEKYKIEGLDLNLYHGKRGSLLRLPNQLRADGRYKVPITLAEARSMTPELYAQLTVAPRQIAVPALPKDAIAAGFASFFAQSKADVEKHLRQGTKTQSVPDEVLAQFGDQLTPKCVEWITNGERCKSMPFNSFAMQVEIYLAKATVGNQRADELREGLVLHGKERSNADAIGAAGPPPSAAQLGGQGGLHVCLRGDVLARLLIMDALQLSREDVRLHLADNLQRTPLKMDGRLPKNWQ